MILISSFKWAFAFIFIYMDIIREAIYHYMGLAALLRLIGLGKSDDVLVVFLDLYNDDGAIYLATVSYYHWKKVHKDLGDADVICLT